MPNPLQQISSQTLNFVNTDHIVGFEIGDVIDPKTKKITGTLKDADGNRVMSSKFIEIHFGDGDAIRIGQQMGMGRMTKTRPKLQ